MLDGHTLGEAAATGLLRHPDPPLSYRPSKENTPDTQESTMEQILYGTRDIIPTPPGCAAAMLTS